MTSKVAVIGVGRMGRYHCRVLSRLGRLGAICDAYQPQKAFEEYKVPFFNDYHDMLKKLPEIQGVIIATPTETHVAVTKELLKYPNLKAILVEKPIATSIEEAQELRQVVANSHIKIYVGHIEDYNPVIQRMIEMIKSNAIGEPRTIVFQRRAAISDGRLESIGDVFQDIGIHDFDIASRLLPKGEYHLLASAITYQNIINAATVVLYGKNTACTFIFSREFAGKVRKIEIEGSIATMIVDLLDQFIEIRQLGVLKGDTQSITVPYGSGEHIKLYGDPLLEENWNFLDTIEGKNPLVDINAGIRALEMVEKARLSEKIQKPVEIYF